MLPGHHHHHPLRQSAASTVGSVSACSDRREMNEAKVQGILSYLDEVQHHPGGGTATAGSVTLQQLQLQQQQQASMLMAQQHSSVSQVAGVAPSPPPAQHPLSASPTDLGHYLNLSQISGAEPTQPPAPLATQQVTTAGGMYVDPTLVQPTSHHHHHVGNTLYNPAASHFTNVSALTATTAANNGPQLGLALHHPSVQESGVSTSGGLSRVDSNVPSVYNGIKGKLQNLKSEADQASKENDKLKAELCQVRVTSQVELKRALEHQEAEFDKKRTGLEKTVDSHLKHMKNLLADKEELTTRVKDLARQNDDMRSKRESELEKMERKHTKAFSEAKARWEATERSKREKWEEERTKKIKGTITTTMEPEIQRMITRHKAELRALEENNAEALQTKQALIEKKDLELSLCKERHGQEIEMVLTREREASRLRLSEETDRSQRSNDHIKQVSQENVDSARREVDQLRSQIRKFEESLLECKVREREVEHQTQQKILSEVEQIRQAKENQILALKEELMGNRQEWAQEHERTQAAYLQQREVEIQKKCENQRDLEIQKVMAEFEKELVEETTSHRAAEKKSREVQGSLTREVDRLKSEHVLLADQREKTMDLLKTKHTESEQLKEEISHLRFELRSSVDQREAEFDRRLKELDQQWDAKLRAVERQSATGADDLKGQLLRKDAEVMQLRTDADGALRSLEQQQHLELSAINDRILVVVSQKDQTIKTLGDENQKLQIEVGRVRAEMAELLQS